MFNECSTIARHLRVFDWVIRVNLNVYINKLYVTSRLFINSKQLVPLGVFTKRRTSQIKAYFTSLLRLSYSCRINTILKKIARVRMAAAKPPHTEFWSRTAAVSSQTSFYTNQLLLRNSHNYFSSQDSRKTAVRQSYDDFSCWHPGWTCQLNVKQVCHAKAARQLHDHKITSWFPSF